MSVIRTTCCLIGDCEVGKTALSKVFKNDGGFSFPKTYVSTCGIEVLVKSINIPDTSDVIELHLLDCSGKEFYQDIFQTLWPKCSMVVLVYDITNEESFQNCTKWLNKFKDVMQSRQIHGGVCIANKIDLSQRRNVVSKAGFEFSKSNQLQYFECSAKESNGVDAPFFYLANECHKRHLDSLG